MSEPKLSERMLLDGMYHGIVEKWAAEVAILELRLETERADCLAEHPPEPWAARMEAENAALRQRLEAARIENTALREWLKRAIDADDAYISDGLRAVRP